MIESVKKKKKERRKVGKRNMKEKKCKVPSCSLSTRKDICYFITWSLFHCTFAYKYAVHVRLLIWRSHCDMKSYSGYRCSFMCKWVCNGRMVKHPATELVRSRVRILQDVLLWFTGRDDESISFPPAISKLTPFVMKFGSSVHT